MIGRNGERRSGISAQAARHDDDDEDSNPCFLCLKSNIISPFISPFCSFRLHRGKS